MKLHYCTGNSKFEVGFPGLPTAFCGRQARDVTPLWAVTRKSVFESDSTCKHCLKAIRQIEEEHPGALEFDARPARNEVRA